MSETAGRRAGVVSQHLGASGEGRYRAELLACKQEVLDLLKDLQCHPILIRLAWHDAGTFDARAGTGGANGSIRFDEELAHGANAGLAKAIRYLKPIQKRHPLVSWADLMQLAAATSIEDAGGPKIAMRYGRLDASHCPAEGNLPDAYPENQTGPDHLRTVFHRMGLTDQDIVALSGAHTLGRAFKERSGTTPCGYGGKNGTQYTGLCPHLNHRPAGARSEEMGMQGGKSWTKEWLVFDNSYYVDYLHNKGQDESLIWFATDHALVTDPEFKKHFALYALDQDAFFRDFSASFKKLSELGSNFNYENLTL